MFNKSYELCLNCYKNTTTFSYLADDVDNIYDPLLEIRIQYVG